MIAGLVWLLCWVLPVPGSPEEAVVATVGGFVITERDLLDSYEFGPSFVKRYPDPLRKHLDYMVYERLLALEAQRLGYDTSAFVRQRVAALEEDLTVDQLYEDEILANIHLTGKEIEEGVQKQRVNLRLRWLHTTDGEEARRFEAELNKRECFDSLYTTHRGKGDAVSDHSLETTLFRLEHDTPQLAAGIAKLKPTQVSAPIEGPDGYYIVRLDGVWQNPVITETEYGTLKDGVTKTLMSSRAEQLAADYVKTQMTGANPVIKAEGFNIVRAYVAEKGLSQDSRVKWDIPSTFMTEAGPQLIGTSGEFLSRPLVFFGNSMITVRDYIVWFDIRQFQLKTSSLEAFNSSIKRTIWKMVQDKLLSDEAYTRQLNRRDEVRKETGKWNAKLLYLAGRSSILHSIRISEESLKLEYERTKSDYKDHAGKPLSFAEARDQVWTTMYYAEEEKILLQTLSRLKTLYPFSYNEEAIHRLTGEIKMESDPVNVIFYKPGGTFPRVAFPTIDESWQRIP